MRVGGIREIKSWILGWGADVEVVAPTELRRQIAEESRRIAQQYTESYPA